MHGGEMTPTLHPSTPSSALPDPTLPLAHPTTEVQKPRVKPPTKRGAPMSLV